MKYNIHITAKAENDLESAADYIEFTLLNPDAAAKLLDDADKAIQTLASAPEAHQLVDDPVLKSWGIRYVLVGNYIAFYIIDEAEKTVHIVRFLYGKRNWMTLLKLPSEIV